MSGARSTVTRAGVAAGLGRLGLGAGETVFFHSSLRSLGYVVGGADAVIDGFRDAVGPAGTVVVPTFTLLGRVGPFGSWYDHQRSPSTVGAITETLRRRPEAIRSFHPIHSVAALGRRAVEVTAGHRHARGRVSPWCDAAFAGGSPFDLLARWDAWYVLLGAGMNVQTIMHYAETALVDAVLRRSSGAARAEAAGRRAAVGHSRGVALARPRPAGRRPPGRRDLQDGGHRRRHRARGALPEHPGGHLRPPGGRP